MNNLTDIVVMTMDPADQNVANIQIIGMVVFETAAILALPSPEMIEPEVIEMVSYCTTCRLVHLLCLMHLILRLFFKSRNSVWMHIAPMESYTPACVLKKMKHCLCHLANTLFAYMHAVVEIYRVKFPRILL